MAVAVFGAVTYAATQLALGAGWIGWQTFMALTVTFAALGAVSRALLGGISEIDSMQGITQNVRASDASRKVVYGKQRVGGVIAWYETKDSCRNNENSTYRNGLDTTRTADNEYLDMIIVLAPHEVESLEEIYLNDRKIWSSDGVGDGWIGSDTDEKFGFTFYDGTQTTYDVDAGHSSTWDSGNKLLDCAYLYCTMVYDTEFYPNGVPNISCVIKGKKIYDPRDSNQDADDDTTWEYSNNPALVLLDYMRDSKYGLGESYDAFNETAPTDSAHVCENALLGAVEDAAEFKIGREYQITLLAGSNFTIIGADSNTVGERFIATGDGSTIGGNGQARQYTQNYTCDGVINTANPIKDNIENILTSMVGTLQYANGKFHINAYSYKTPQTDVIDQDMLVAPIQVTTKTSRRTLYNAVKGRFNSDIHNYQITDYPAQVSDTYATNDGETIFLDVDLPFTTHDIMAQRVARLTMLKSRLQQVIQISCNLQAMKYKVGDNIKLTYDRFGWSEKIFEINAFRLVPSAEDGLVVEISATENASSAYVWNTSDQIDFTVGGEVSLYDGTLPAPTNLVLEPYSEDGRSYVKASWTASTGQGTIKYKSFYRRNADNYRPFPQAITYGTNAVFEIYEGYQDEEIEIVVNAVSESYGTTSAQLRGTCVVANIPKDNPARIIRGQSSTPSVDTLTRLAKESGIDLDTGVEVTYIRTDGSGNPIDSTDFVFEKIDLSSIPQVTDTEVFAQTFSDIMPNGTFTNSDDWIFSGDSGNWDISGGKANFDYTSGLGYLYTLVNGLVVNKTYTLTGVASNFAMSGGNLMYIGFLDSVTGAVLETFEVDQNGSFSHDFTATTDEVFIAFIPTIADGTVSFDDMTFTRNDEKAKHSVLMSLPASVTDDVTWTVTTISSSNPSDATLTTNYTTGTNTLINGRKSIELSLERDDTTIGYSLFNVEVTAEWTEVSNFGGTNNNIDKSATRTINLIARNI